MSNQTFEFLDHDGRLIYTISATSLREAILKANKRNHERGALSPIVVVKPQNSNDYQNLIERKQQLESEIIDFMNEKIRAFQNETGIGISEVKIETVVLNQLEKNRHAKVDDVKVELNLEGIQ